MNRTHIDPTKEPLLQQFYQACQSGQTEIIQLCLNAKHPKGLLRRLQHPKNLLCGLFSKTEPNAINKPDIIGIALYIATSHKQWDVIRLILQHTQTNPSHGAPPSFGILRRIFSETAKQGQLHLVITMCTHPFFQSFWEANQTDPNVCQLDDLLLTVSRNKQHPIAEFLLSDAMPTTPARITENLVLHIFGSSDIKLLHILCNAGITPQHLPTAIQAIMGSAHFEEVRILKSHWAGQERQQLLQRAGIPTLSDTPSRRL